MMHGNRFGWLFLALACGAWGQTARPRRAELVSARKIWDRAPHNAFTDLARYKGRWYCAFREGAAHVSPDGALRVITSADGERWTSSDLLTWPNSDVRDAKLTITPDGRLMLSGAAALHQPAAASHQSVVWFSNDGRAWGDGIPVADPNFWLWRVTWHRGSAFGFAYGTADNRFVRLYSSRNGFEFRTLADRVFEEGYPNESSIVFLNDDTALCLLRRDGQPNTALLGTSRPPYRAWTWQDLGVRIGGPHMTLAPDGRIVAGVRLYDPRVRTSLCWLDRQAGRLTEFLALPSGGDSSYPGLVWHEGLLWVSYYSSHEGKTSIYLAKVRLPDAAGVRPVKPIGRD
ncbi:MAG: exo-alpha-sialidase [Acidobacteria bacterium]|nr:exo-alpha-sialidase [Acidobacteriota bacterium]